MSSLPITHLRGRILLHLYHEPAENVSVLADALHVSRPSMSRAVGSLIKADLVTKAGRQVELTDAGASAAWALQQQLPNKVEEIRKVVVRVIEEASAAKALPEITALSDSLSSVFRTVPMPTMVDLGLTDVPAAAASVFPKTPKFLPAGFIESLGSAFPTPADLGLTDVLSTWRFGDTSDLIGTGGFGVNLQALIDDIHATIGSIVAGQLASLEAAFRDIGEWFKEFTDTLDALELAGPAIKPIFVAAGFWITPRMPHYLLRHTKELHDTGQLTRETLRALIVRTYREDDCMLLRETVRDWQDNPLFAVRWAILLDALEAHCDGKYTLSVPALLPQIESIASALTGVPHGKPYHIVKAAAEKVDSHYIPAITREVLLTYITTMAYANTRNPVFEQELARHSVQSKEVLQRHAILHGQIVDYASEENSLRAFLLLDVLSAIPVPATLT